MAEKLEKRLALNEWMFKQFGFTDLEEGMKRLGEILRDVDTGWDEQNVFYFRRKLEISLPENRKITNDLLIEYDRNIFDHWQSITKERRIKEHRDIFPLYFQYMALLFTEFYLDKWTQDLQNQTTILLDSLNSYLLEFNQRFVGRTAASDFVENYTESDLTKLAFWIATGGGKTLIMHCNIKQLELYLNKRNLRRYYNKIILITPNEGLTDQHIDEFFLSEIYAERYAKDKGASFGIEVIEITKLKETTGVTTVAVEEFGRNNIVLVDEGHRGSGGDEWFSKRQYLCSEGFSFEYSATFGQSVNSLSGNKQKEMGQLYAKSVLFDYSYKFFFGDGYGKDFQILNFNTEENAISEENYKVYLTASILRFYQQCKLFKDKHNQYASYLIEDPLLVFVGGSVTGTRQQAHDTDVITALAFFAEFIRNETSTIQRLSLLLKSMDELRDDQGLVFRSAFDYVKNIFPVTNTESPRNLFQDILDTVFNANGNGLMHAVYLKGSGNEIGLRIGDDGDYFGVINVGEPKKLWDMLEERHGENIICQEQQFSVSLFDSIKNKNSKIRVLIGAKKFTEGWNSWRVSSMGLVNVGRNEGSQIIQLFGRGVRLKGLDFSLIRTSHQRQVTHPPYVVELETLNIFGIRSDYMKAFNDYIDEEDVSSEKKIETITLPLIENLARTDLKVILPKKDMPEFKKEVKPQFGRYDKIRTKVSADWYTRLDSKTSRYYLHSTDETAYIPTTLKPHNLKFLDFDKLYLELLKYKKQFAMYNLEISKETVKEIIKQTDWYDLFIPEHMLEFTSFEKVQLWQEIASDLLKKYCRKYYDFVKDEFEAPYQEYRTIKDLLDEPDEKKKQFLQNIRFEYQIAVEKSQEQLIIDLNTIKRKITDGEFEPYEIREMSIFKFDQHLYHPLIYVTKGAVGISVKPLQLNKHEKQFIDDLKSWCEKTDNMILANKELYVLRNQSKGKGISFFDEGNFYPDFILWLVDNDKQYINFVDPHGLQYARGLLDSKIQFHNRIKEIERERLNDPTVSLNSFILSPTRYNEVKHWNGGTEITEFNNNHVLFMYDDPVGYIQMIFEKVQGE